MYTEIDALGLAETTATRIVIAKRRHYVPFFAAAEALAHKRKMIIGGDVGLHMLLGTPIDLINPQYEFLSDNALTDARELTDALYKVAPDGLGHYTNMRTIVPQREFVVSVNERPLFHVTAFAVTRGVRLVDIILPSTRPATFAKTSDGEPVPLLCLGPEIQLIDVYARLSNPAYAKTWVDLLRAEEVLRVMFLAEIRMKLQRMLRGTEAHSSGHESMDRDAVIPTEARMSLHHGSGDSEDDVRTSLHKTDSSSAHVIKTFFDEYVPRSGHVLVGEGARTTSTPPTLKRIQIVTANRLKDEEAVVGRIARRLGFRTQSTTNDPKIPTDSRLRRMTIYRVQSGARRVPFLDIYNSGEYEILPTTEPTHAGVRAGTFFVRLRYLLVDIWTMLLIHMMKMVDSRYARDVVEKFVKEFERTAGEYTAARDAATTSDDLSTLFPTQADDYVGRYSDPVIAAKRLRFENVRRAFQKSGARRPNYWPYYPARSARKTART